MANWRRQLSSLGYSKQPTYQDETATDGTGGTSDDFTWVLCEPVDVDLAREITSSELLEGQEGAVGERQVGSRHGSKATIAFPLRTLHADYDGTTDAPILKVAPEWGLIAPFFGCGPSTAVTGTAQVSTSTTLKLAAGDANPDDFYNNDIVEITGGTGSGQYNKITDYATATKIATVENTWETTPDVTSTYSIVKMPNSPTYTSVYDANDVDAGSAGVSIVHVAGDYKAGDFYIAATTDATDNSPTMAWIETGKTGAATLTTFEPPEFIPASGDETFPTLTYYMATTQPQPLTMRLASDVTGNATLVLIGGIPESLSISLDPRTVPRAEVSYVFTDYRWDTGLEGLHVPTDSFKVPPVLGTNNGRATMGDTSDGGTTAAGAVQCGLGSVAFSMTNEIAYSYCHSAAQGVDGATVVKRTSRCEFTVPHDSADLNYDSAGNAAASGQHKWSSYLERGVARSVAFYVGSAVGKCFSLFMPSAKIVEQPKLTDADGLYAYQVAVEAVAYAGDTNDGQAGAAVNSNARIGIG